MFYEPPDPDEEEVKRDREQLQIQQDKLVRLDPAEPVGSAPVDGPSFECKICYCEYAERQAFAIDCEH